MEWLLTPRGMPHEIREPAHRRHHHRLDLRHVRRLRVGLVPGLQHPEPGRRRLRHGWRAWRGQPVPGQGAAAARGHHHHAGRRGGLRLPVRPGGAAHRAGRQAADRGHRRHVLLHLRAVVLHRRGGQGAVRDRRARRADPVERPGAHSGQPQLRARGHPGAGLRDHHRRGVLALHQVYPRRQGARGEGRERGRRADRRDRHQAVPAADLHRDRGDRRRVRHRGVADHRVHVPVRRDDLAHRIPRRRLRRLPQARPGAGRRAVHRRTRGDARRLRQRGVRRHGAVRDPRRGDPRLAARPRLRIGGKRMNQFLAASSRAFQWSSAVASSRAARRGPRGGVPTAIVLVAGALIVLNYGLLYTGSVFVLSACYAIVTAGMAVQIGFSQQIAFSQSVFFGVGAYGVAMLNTHYNISVLLAGVIMVVAAALVALLLGSVVTRASGLALAVATLMLPLIAVGYVSGTGFLGGPVGAPLTGTLWPGSGSTTLIALGGGIIVVVLLAAVVFMASRILSSDIGLELFVLGVDERTAASLGVRTPRRKLELFVLGCVCAALGGVVYAGTQQFVPETAIDPTTELALLIMLFIGGRRSVIGAVIGALVIQYLQGASNWVSVNILVVEGLLLTVVLLVDPEGLAGIVETGIAWLRGKSGQATVDRELVPAELAAADLAAADLAAAATPAVGAGPVAAGADREAPDETAG